jgi:predicted RNA-binding protein YlqC (UPF0109 family)
MNVLAIRTEQPKSDAETLIETMVFALVDDPNNVSIEIERVPLNESDERYVIQIRTAPEDLGKVIGKAGRHARAMRVILSAWAQREKVSVTLDIMQSAVIGEEIEKR